MTEDLWIKLKNTNKPILLYGIGNGADKIYNELRLNGINISGVFATAGFVREKVIYGFNLTDYDTVKKQIPEMIVLVCFGSNRSEVFSEIKRISAEQELYFPDVPVYGNDIFNLCYAKANKERLEKVYSLLADEKSRETFKNTVMYKLTGVCDYLYDCEVSANEPYESFFNLNNNETYLDLGAYTGDTVADFIKNTEDYNEIIAVEPNARSFRKLCENTENLKNITLINKYISDSKKLIEISKGKGRGTSAKAGGVTVETDYVDSIAKDKNITLIKADVEGEEIPMISGAGETILKCRPKMQIACYHRSDDLWTIPEAILDICPDYDVFIRHFPYLPAWDTNFYFVPKNK
ncbi:MAG: FkbM family methyltransferase [Clostridia bacterium]|nr:FkbM family methyltransferase [Clostridia bacterium]